MTKKRCPFCGKVIDEEVVDVCKHFSYHYSDISGLTYFVFTRNGKDLEVKL